MKQKNIILNSLKETFSIIKVNRKMFVFIFILQLIFLSLILHVNILYFPPVVDSIKEVIEYMDEQKFDDTTIGLEILQQKNILGPDPLLISRNYKNILSNMRFLTLYSMLIFIIINGSIWFLSSSLLEKKLFSLKDSWNSILKYILKFGLITFIFSALIYLFSNSIIKKYFIIDQSQNFNFYPILIISLILLYFVYISFSLLYKTHLKNILKNLIIIGIKKAHVILSAYIIIIISFIVIASLSLYLIERNLFLLFISLIFLILAVILSRIFLIRVVDKLS